MQETVKVYTHSPVKVNWYKGKVIEFKKDPESGQAVAEIEPDIAGRLLSDPAAYSTSPLPKQVRKSSSPMYRRVKPPVQKIVNENMEGRISRKNRVFKLSANDLKRKIFEEQAAIARAKAGLPDPKEEARQPPKLSDDSNLPPIKPEAGTEDVSRETQRLIVPGDSPMDISKLSQPKAQQFINEARTEEVLTALESFERGRIPGPRGPVLSMIEKRKTELGGE